MTIKSITNLIRHCNSHSPISQNSDFRGKLNFFREGVSPFPEQSPLPRRPLMTASPVGVRDIRNVFERMSTSQSSQVNPSQMFWGMPTRLSGSASHLESQPLSVELPSSTDAHLISEKADKGKGKVTASESVEKQESLAGALIQQLEEFCLQLNAKDHAGQYKRAKGHYFALQGQQLVWKPFHKEGEWQRKERVEAKEAFLHLLDVLEQAAKADIKEINDRFPDSGEVEENTLNGVLEKIINREWCKSLLTDKVVQQKYIDVCYLILFKGNLDNAHEIDSCLREAGPALDVIVRILSSNQLKAVAKAMPGIYEKGLPQIGLLGAKEQSDSFARVLDKGRSWVILKKMHQEFQKKLEMYRSHKIHQTGLNRLNESERRDLFLCLGMGKIYDSLTPDQHESYLQDLILRYPDRITVYNGRSLTEFSENLRECQRLTNESLDLHRKWAEDPKKNLEKFIADTLNGRAEVQAQQDLADKNFGGVIIAIFGTGNKIGNVREMLSTSLLEIFDRSLSYLETAHLEESQLAAYKASRGLLKGNINWSEVPALFIQLRHDMETRGLG